MYSVTLVVQMWYQVCRIVWCSTWISDGSGIEGRRHFYAFNEILWRHSINKDCYWSISPPLPSSTHCLWNILRVFLCFFACSLSVLFLRFKYITILHCALVESDILWKQQMFSAVLNGKIQYFCKVLFLYYLKSFL